ncbi:MAG: hypothetical protein PHP41_05515 [Bacilli bacterium]|nr:hypothetical protein [Bacilli bacterium]MDD3533924.1 hypothetical protein [Candidatus Cloacimonadota bacterium]
MNIVKIKTFFSFPKYDLKLGLLLLVEFVALFIILRYVLGVSAQFMASADDGYYTHAVLGNGAIFQNGGGWMNYAILSWYRFFPVDWHPYVALTFRFLFYFTALMIIRKLYSQDSTEKRITYLVFMFPLLFYYVFKPSSEIFILPVLVYMIYQLAWDRIHKWHEYLVFFGCFFFISQMKPALGTLAIYASIRVLLKKRYLLTTILIFSLFGNYWVFNQLSSDDTEGMPELSIVLFNGLRQKQIIKEVFSGEAELSNADYPASVVRDYSYPEMQRILAEEGKTNIDMARYLIQHPEIVAANIGMNFFNLFGGIGRLYIAGPLFLFNFCIYLMVFFLTKKYNKKHFEIFMLCMAYLLFFLLLNVRFRYTYPVMPVVYYLFAVNMHHYLVQRRAQIKQSNPQPA